LKQGLASNKKALYLTIAISIIVSKVIMLSIKHYIPSNYDMLGHLAFTRTLVNVAHVPTQDVVYADVYGSSSGQHILMGLLNLITSLDIVYVAKVYSIASALLASQLAILLMFSTNGKRVSYLIIQPLFVALILPNFADITGTKLGVINLLVYLYSLYKLFDNNTWRNNLITTIAAINLILTHDVTAVYILVINTLFIGVSILRHHNRHRTELYGVIIPIISYLVAKLVSNNFIFSSFIMDFLESYHKLLFGEEVLTINERYKSFYLMPPSAKIVSMILYSGYPILLITLSVIVMLIILFNKNRKTFEIYSLIALQISIGLFISVSYISNLKVRFMYYAFAYIIFTSRRLFSLLNNIGRKISPKKGKIWKLMLYLMFISLFIVSLIGQEGIRIQELVPVFSDENNTKVFYFSIDEATDVEQIVVLSSLLKYNIQPVISINFPYMLYYIYPYKTIGVRNIYYCNIPENSILVIIIQPRYSTKTDLEAKKCFEELCRNGVLSLIFNADILRAGIRS
jgi:hypothetical protein